MEVLRVLAPSLERFGRTLIGAMGVSQDHAALVTEALMHGSLCCHPGQGQGFDKLPKMWERIQVGTIDPQAAVEVLSVGPSWLLIEGNNGLGPVVAAHAMDAAIARAEENGIGCAFVRGSTHLGSTGFHALRAAHHELIGLCMTNAGPEMAPWGGVTSILGTNPWGIAVPTKRDFPLLLDIALTQSGKGMVRWHQLLGLPIPSNWAYAPDGSTTDDPEQALLGPLVPIGEYKGVGLSFMTDVLCGVLTGAAFGKDSYSDPARHNVGHFMLAIDPATLMPRERFYERLDAFCAQVKSSDKAQGISEVYLPGEIEHLRMSERLREGIPVSSTTTAALCALAEELGVAFDVEFETPRDVSEG